MSDTPKIVIHMEGGLIQWIGSTLPVEVVVVDYDTEGASDDELVDIPQGGGGFEEAVASFRHVEVNESETTPWINSVYATVAEAS